MRTPLRSSYVPEEMANDALELEPECIAEEEKRQLQEAKKDPPSPKKICCEGVSGSFCRPQAPENV